MDTFQMPPPGTTMSSYPRRPQKFWASALTCLIVVAILTAIVILSVWSINFVSQGVVAAGLIPPDTPITMIRAFVAGLQAPVVLLGLAARRFFSPVKVIKVLFLGVVVAVCVGLVGFEAYHQVFRQLQLSAGTGFERLEHAELDRIERGITELSRQRLSLYAAKLGALQASIKAAKEGRDRTGVATCGPICQGRMELYEVASTRFESLGVDTVPLPLTGVDLRTRLIDNRQRLNSLKAAQASLARFYAAVDNSVTPSMITDAIAQFDELLTRKEHEYSGIAMIDAKSIALMRTAESFGLLLEGKAPRDDAVLAIAYGLAPYLAILALEILLWVVVDAAGRSPKLDELEHDIAVEEEAARKLRRLARLRHANFFNTIRANAKRWEHV